MLNFLGIENIEFGGLGLGKYAFGALILFILIYLVRPKPTERIIPSLMFLISRRKKGKFNSFLRKIFRDPLFFFQFLLLLFLCIAAIEPFATYEHDISSENTVLVLDVSASMYAGNNFKEMKKIAKDSMKGSISAITIKKYPAVLFEDELPGRAREMIDLVQPSVSASNILDAMKKAEELMGNKTGKIVVISDFIDTESSQGEIVQYKKYLEGKGRIVDMIALKRADDNIGFVSSEISNNRLTLAVKNYNNKIEKPKVKAGDKSIEIEIQPHSVEVVKLDVEKGLSTISLNVVDDFDLDNKFYMNIPTNKEMSVLLITNRKESYIIDFLSSSPYINLEISEPPDMPSMEYDAIVFAHVDKELILKKITDDLSDYIKNGGALIVHGQDNLNSMGISDMLPVDIGGKKEETEPTVIQHEITKDLTFSKIVNYWEATLKESAVSVVNAEGSVVAFWQYGKGNVMYYGIPEDKNDFKISASYPLFWNRALRFISKFNDFDSLNRKSYELDYDDKVGFIEASHKTIAVNLLDEKESNVLGGEEMETFTMEIGGGKESSFVVEEFDLLLIILPLIIFLMIIEILFIKYRGDI